MHISERVAAATLSGLASFAILLSGCGGGQSNAIKIGLQGPMTGDYAYEGKGFENAVRLLADRANAAGGILGRPVQLLIEDDAGDPTQSALVAQRLVDGGAIAVIGAYNSTATEPASEIYNEAGILHITPSSTAVRLTQKGFPLFFRVCFVDDRQGQFAGDFMTQVLGAKRIGILHDNSTYAQGLGEEARRHLERLAVDVAFYDAINPTDKDFAPILTRIGAQRLDAVFFTGYHSQFGLLMKQSRALGLPITWVAGDACNNPVMIEIAGAVNAQGNYVITEPLPKDLDYPEAHDFMAAYAARYGEPPASTWTIMAAEAFHVIRTAIEQTGSDDPGVLANHLHTTLKDLNGLTGPILGFDEKGDRLGTIHLAYRIDGQGHFVVHERQPGEVSAAQD